MIGKNILHGFYRPRTIFGTGAKERLYLLSSFNKHEKNANAAEISKTFK